MARPSSLRLIAAVVLSVGALTVSAATATAAVSGPTGPTVEISADSAAGPAPDGRTGSWAW